jgi:cadmium resistance protein CadD (predicted permease)
MANMGIGLIIAGIVFFFIGGFLRATVVNVPTAWIVELLGVIGVIIGLYILFFSDSKPKNKRPK